MREYHAKHDPHPEDSEQLWWGVHAQRQRQRESERAANSSHADEAKEVDRLGRAVSGCIRSIEPPVPW